MTRGKFITFEGGEGSGKSTQVTRLVDRLRLRGIDVLHTREPGGSPGAEAMRHVLLGGMVKPLGPTAETMIFAAARDDHMQTTILPALERGTWVVCDRFIDSTRVYQGVLGRVDPALIRALERLTVGDLMPDMTIILDVPVEVGLARVRERGEKADRFEAEDLEFHQRLREAYREIAQREKARCALIDASQGPDVVAVRIWMSVVERLLKGKTPAAAPKVAS